MVPSTGKRLRYTPPHTHTITLLEVQQEQQAIQPLIYAENLAQTHVSLQSVCAPMRPDYLILWAVVTWCPQLL